MLNEFVKLLTNYVQEPVKREHEFSELADNLDRFSYANYIGLILILASMIFFCFVGLAYMGFGSALPMNLNFHR